MSGGSLNSRQIVVDDYAQPCPYLPHETARMPLRLPLEQMAPGEIDSSLANGDRRSGVFVYRTACPDCQACQAIRLDVDTFRPTRSQSRVARRAENALAVTVGPPVADQQRVDLYNLHRRCRNLGRNDLEIDLKSYVDFLVHSCMETVEISYRLDNELVGVGISDCGEKAVSAVYFYFDPQFSRLSPGVYNVLKQVELCREWSKQYLYLGYYIADCRHMNYKSNYLPHERLIAGQWRKFVEKG